MNPHDYCQDKAAKSGSSFYYSFMFLPPERRQAITALYAFCREVDDVVDECHDLSLAQTKLEWWRQEVGRIYGGTPTHPVGHALKDVIKGFRLPQEQLLELQAPVVVEPREPDEEREHPCPATEPAGFGIEEKRAAEVAAGEPGVERKQGNQLGLCAAGGVDRHAADVV